jgi:hypothetical protein
MSSVDDEGWEARMAARAAARSERDRGQWPVPQELRGASARDAFLWYIVDGWQKIFGEQPPVENVQDNDFGYHVLRKGSWQLTLVNLDQYPAEDEQRG